MFQFFPFAVAAAVSDGIARAHFPILSFAEGYRTNGAYVTWSVLFVEQNFHHSSQCFSLTRSGNSTVIPLLLLILFSRL